MPPSHPTRVVARLLPEQGPATPVEIAAAPSAPEPERGWLSALLPGLSALGMLGFALLSPSVLIIAICGSVAVLSVVAAVWSTRHSRRRRDRQWKERRERYLAHLAACVRVLNEAERRQRGYAEAAHPPPQLAASEAAAGRLWNRRVDDADFFQVRLGLGRCPARRQPRLHSAEGDPDGERDLLAFAADVVARHGCLDAIPLTIDLAEHPTTTVSFDQLSTLRAVVVSLVTSHGPDLLRLHALAAPAELDWLSALPQAACVGTDEAALMTALRRMRASGADPNVHPLRDVIVLAGDEKHTRAALHALGVLQSRTPDRPITALALLDGQTGLPAQVTLAVRSEVDGGVLVTTPGESPQALAIARADGVTHAQALALTDAVRDFRLTDVAASTSDSPVLLASLLAAEPEQRLRIPIGRDDEGTPATLDLREAARGGDGPHGLVIGATGTGKSELLRSLVIAAAHQSTPAELALLLIDYKGGAAFAELSRLPHTAGLVTNLNSDRHGIDRLCASLRAELRRRQRTLRDAGVEDIDAYQARRRSPLPRLLVVVDEYAELIEESPDVLEVLTSLGRLGRSLGIHLLLASQRLDDGRLRGLDAHLRYRICLRTSSASESVAVIGSPVAAGLPSAPGWGWLRRDGVLTRLRVALVREPGQAVDAVSARHGDPETEPIRPVCLPPLPDLLNRDGSDQPWRADVGLLDRPDLGEQRPLILDLTGPAAHVAVAGAPRSGRSTTLATLVTMLAASTPPRGLAIHVVSSATSPLAGTAGLPHVGTVATSQELTGRVIRAVADTVARRHAAGGLDRATEGHLLLVVDDVKSATDSDDSLTEILSRIATAGLSVGVSLALSCGRWSELRGALREAIGTRWELRLNDPVESSFPQLTRLMTRVPAGRVLTGDGHWAQIAQPRADVAAIARRGGRATRPIQLLPSRVLATTLPAPSRQGRVPLAVGGTYGEPVEMTLTPGEHLIVLGNADSGRSGLLRSIAGFAADAGAGLWVIDPRRSLARPALDPRRRASGPQQVARLVDDLVVHLEGKQEPDPANAETLTHDLLIVDDFDLAAGRFGATPFGRLAEVLPFAAELGLSVVVARRVSGSSRAAFDPFFGRLLELCDTGVLLSGDPSEGPVIGGLRPRVRPPGRAELVLRGEPAGEVQTAWSEPYSTADLLAHS